MRIVLLCYLLIFLLKIAVSLYFWSFVYDLLFPSLIPLLVCKFSFKDCNQTFHPVKNVIYYFSSFHYIYSLKYFSLYGDVITESILPSVILTVKHLNLSLLPCYVSLNTSINICFS